MNKFESCLVPECEIVARCRGLCSTHYLTALRLVKSGKSTWHQLEVAGKVLPVGRRGKSKATDWFLNV